MAGGLLNLKAVGANNVILNGNPTKTFFKVTYAKYTNFGLQKFRIDYDGLRELRPTEDSVFNFRIPRYAELLMDTYIVVTLPDIWSPIYHPSIHTNNRWVPYEFRWIREIGVRMIKEVVLSCGSTVIQRYTGDYLAGVVDRDFSTEKKALFDSMSGNTSELHDPGNVDGRVNTYPSAFYTESTTGAEPSIRGRNLYIPINSWFTLDQRRAFPLIALQYNTLNISVTLRPIQDLFQVRDVFDSQYNYPYIRPDFNEDRFQMYRFLQTPPSVFGDASYYENRVNTWNADVHLMATYCFLSPEEATKFACEDHVYLVKDVYEHKFENVTGTKKLKLMSSGMVSNWMWFLQRNDVNMRNEWSNYTNWPYRRMPETVQLAPIKIGSLIPPNAIPKNYGPAIDPQDGRNTGLYITGNFKTVNRKHILETMGILMNGDYRENILTRGVFDYIEKYTRTQGFAKEGLYCYNFALNSDTREYQPSGAINMSKFKNIELEITTHIPDIDLENANFDVICNAEGQPIGVRKLNYQLFDYAYNFVLYEERYNVLSFIGGNCGLMYAR